LVLEDRTLLSSFIVENTQDNGTGSLRAAIGQAGTNDTIFFDAALFSGSAHRTMTLTSGVLDITKALTIVGPAANLLTISGNHTQGVFNVTAGSPSLPVTLFDLTIADGSSSTGGTGIANGGTLTLSHGTISGNTAHFAGGISNSYKGTMTLVGCTVSGNTATRTAGGGISNYGTMTLRDCTVADNSAPGSGGGIFSYGDSPRAPGLRARLVVLA
jgi:hypothetical protein